MKRSANKFVSERRGLKKDVVDELLSLRVIPHVTGEKSHSLCWNHFGFLHTSKPIDGASTSDQDAANMAEALSHPSKCIDNTRYYCR